MLRYSGWLVWQHDIGLPNLAHLVFAHYHSGLFTFPAEEVEVVMVVLVSMYGREESGKEGGEEGAIKEGRGEWGGELARKEGEEGGGGGGGVTAVAIREAERGCMVVGGGRGEM